MGLCGLVGGWQLHIDDNDSVELFGSAGMRHEGMMREIKGGGAGGGGMITNDGPRDQFCSEGYGPTCGRGTCLISTLRPACPRSQI